MNDTAPKNLEGWVPELASPGELLAALDKAFDYRGDVTVTLKNQSVVSGYLFDRRTGGGLDDSFARLMPEDGGANLEVRYADIARLQFADRDPASGKSWETWVRKYAEKKSKGESASISGDFDDHA